MHVAHDVMCTVHFFGVYLYPAKNTVIPYHLIFNALKCFKVLLPLTLLTALLLTLLMMYFQFIGWRYTPSVLTNENHCYMPQLYDNYICKT